MIDEAQRFLDVALAVARLRVVLADQPAQRRAHLLVGGGRRNAERFVERGFHRIAWRTLVRAYAIGIFVENGSRGKAQVQDPRQRVSRRRDLHETRARSAATAALRAPETRTGSRAAGPRLACPAAFAAGGYVAGSLALCPVHVAVELLADARRLAGATAQVVELRAAHVALALDLDRRDQRRVGLERALDAFAAA